jgi:hypothetical protein
VAAIDHVFRGFPAPRRDLVCPHLDRADFNCDAEDNVLDVVRVIEIVFRGGSPPCQPCLCPPYPAMCQ